MAHPPSTGLAESIVTDRVPGRGDASTPLWWTSCGVLFINRDYRDYTVYVFCNLVKELVATPNHKTPGAIMGTLSELKSLRHTAGGLCVPWCTMNNWYNAARDLLRGSTCTKCCELTEDLWLALFRGSRR